MVLEKMNKLFHKICYLSFTKDGKSIARLLEKESMEPSRFVFVQTVSGSEKLSNSFYAGSPNDLTKISLTYTSAIGKTEPDSVFSDSITALFIYQDEKTVLRFIISLINKTKANGSKIVFLISMENKYISTIKELYMYSDKIIDLRKNDSA